MERKEFLSLLGLGTAGIFTLPVWAPVQNLPVSYTPMCTTNVDISLDLSLPANAPLNTAGGYIYTGGIIVAKTTAGNYIAVSQDCTHQGVSVQYQANRNQRFYCPSHGATFSETGTL